MVTPGVSSSGVNISRHLHLPHYTDYLENSNRRRRVFKPDLRAYLELLNRSY